ncbi:putative polyketide synthase [Aspergillus violaceofuscus CBS 115571]|uniref:Putative polyketide synthase n=1 Tax=Aspergillus violaceofuscus (strain CBS 115571) TaxID=1450538 RepID=A0A2V5H945_ASPV1|nr:putative polyketide synthase [Aspergillus violaceofuscus CBS 115571]
MESLQADPPCIIGMACRLPGDIRSPSDLWDFLVEEKSGQGPVPAERYNIKGYYHPDGHRSGGMDVPGGYFINEDVRQFENSFFGINNLEATYMDPQQRKLLEVVYECLESAGTSMKSISGSNTGVFVGNFSVDYQPMQTRDPDYLHRYTSTGSGATIMSNRISHVFNLHGPSFTLDTACSSSVYALHQALTAMKIGDCDSCIVASANLIMSPELHIGAAKGGVLSPTGTCHTFDASADGYGRAEGVNAIYIKRLSAALRDGNPVRAVIRGSAINANGKTPGISLPSRELQETVMRKAYQNAGLDFASTDYVECHGTGTPVGDPIEVDAVGRCFSPRPEVQLLIGSVKTNVGHSEAASGLTSVLKVAMAFENAKIPPSRGVVKLNPKLILEERNLKIATKVEEWPRALRRASVNSFGYGGANAHVILESIQSYLGDNYREQIRSISGPSVSETPQLLVLPVSASSISSLEARMKGVARAVAQNPGQEALANLAYTLTKGRDHLQYRSFHIASADGKLNLGEDAATPGRSDKGYPFAFVFTGQGAQYAGMAKELLLQSEHFRATIHGLDRVLQRLPVPYAPNWTIEQTLLNDDPKTSDINKVTHSQPICTAIQIGIIELLRSWDVQPAAVVGHSSGEIAAAYAAGLLSSTQAILVAYYRGYAVGKLQTKGSMMAAGIGAEAAKQLIKSQGLETQVQVACVNAPESVTLSGSSEAVDAIHEELQAQKKFARKLDTGGRAYHSHMMKEVGPLYEELLADLLTLPGDDKQESPVSGSEVKMYSSVGHDPTELRVLDRNSTRATNLAAYWRENLEQPVQFNSALATLAAGGKRHLIEIGPHSTLKGPIQQVRAAMGLDQSSLPYSATLVRKVDADVSLKQLAGTLYAAGHALNWDKVDGLPRSGLEAVHSLPPYQWDYSSGLRWSEPRASVEIRNRKHLRHELLGTLALTGNNIDFTWRNLLRLSEMPWIQDHMLEGQVVFPATGYIATAIEAVSRITGVKDRSNKSNVAFHIRNMNISAALVVPEENDPAAKDLELHTTMSLRKSSTANTSAYWYDFSITSWAAGQTTVHCTGSIRLAEPRTGAGKGSVTVKDDKGFEAWAMTRWYSKWRQEGLCFGPQFQSLTSLRTDSARTRNEAISVTHLDPPNTEHKEEYPVHPITLDACIQAAILGGTAGRLSSLKAYLPVFIADCQIQPPQEPLSGSEVEIHARSVETGFNSRKVDSTLWDARGAPIVEFTDVRMSLYTGKSGSQTQPESNSPLDLYLQRQPTLRVHWKPDMLRLAPNADSHLRRYVTSFVDRQAPDIQDDESLGIIGALIDLAGHKFPRMRVLELGGDQLGYKAQQWLQILDKDTAFARCRSWHAGSVDEDGCFTIQDNIDGPFEVLILPGLTSSKQQWIQAAEPILSSLSDQGVIITRISDEAVEALAKAGFTLFDVGKRILFATRPAATSNLKGRNGFIVIPQNPAPAVTSFANSLSEFLTTKATLSAVKVVPIDQIQTVGLTEKDICVSLLEATREYLATMSPQQMDWLRVMTDVATDLLWVTGANMLSSQPDPNLTLANGLSRALMLEQPALRYSVLDLGSFQSLESLDHVERACENVVQALVTRQTADDCEFIQVDGLLYVSRFGPDFGVNAAFRRRLDPEAPIEKETLEAAKPAQLSIGRAGVMDSMHFQQLAPETTPPAAGYVDIAVKAVGLNAKDVYAINGRVDTRDKTTALDFAGVITAVGPDVRHLKVGDRAVAWMPSHFRTTERVPAGAVHRLLDHEELTVVPTLLTVYGTALYALHDRAHIRAGESILIHAGSGGVGIAAITLAQQLGAIVYTTVGSPAKRDYLIRELGVPASHIFNSRDGSFVPAIREATGGRGVDIVLNSLVGDLMHESWDCLAEFGRFVEIGKRELLDAGKLDMRVFLRNVTFTAFDLSELFYAKDSWNRSIWDRLMAETMTLYREGKIQPPPLKVFDITEVAQAYRFFANKDRVGKVVISMENAKARVPVMPTLYRTTFDSDKVYLLIGCLGGLGRSLSRWMMTRGARHFVFLGRSGLDRSSAQQLVSRLEGAGAQVAVVRGDVSKAADVQAAVAACVALGRPIGGVVQAAMGLHEALFTRMPNEAWHTGIDPKWQGTWNLHNALEGHDDQLDFFLLTSSVSGTVGTATESNYCSANGFLDAFARWRRSQGKCAVAVGLGMISEVGYLHENPDIEALLLRKGIQPLNEEEFLQVLDLALESEAAHKLDEAHMLTGLEPAGVRELSARGFDVTSHGVLVEARAGILSAALLAEQEVRAGGSGEARGSDRQVVTSAAPWFKELPSTMTGTFASEADAESLLVAIVRLLKKRFANLILMPLDQIDDQKPLPEFGVDSMIASEFRTWFWTVFRVDIPFLDIMSVRKNLSLLAQFVETKLPQN